MIHRWILENGCKGWEEIEASCQSAGARPCDVVQASSANDTVPPLARVPPRLAIQL
jgi:hypothetical protein